MSLEKLGHKCTLLFVALLPWSVVISVFFWDKFQIQFIHYWKELFLIFITGIYIWQIIRDKIKVTVDTLDIGILLYLLWLIIVSLLTHTPIKWYIYGLRYDAEFLFAFLLFRRTLPLWRVTLSDIAKNLLISGGIILACSLLVRYVFSEMILTAIGFSDHVSVWDGVRSAPPIYHGIPGASVVRFQGMLEWPNQMAFFLVVYMATYLLTFAKYRSYRFFNFLVIASLCALQIMTYSRSGYLATAILIGWFTVSSLWSYIHKHKRNSPRFLFSWKKILLASVIGFSIIFGVFLQFNNKFEEIFGRPGSTSGHFERMHIGFLRFRESPLGSGLAQSGPASRSITMVNEDPILDVPTDPVLKKVLQELHDNNPDFIFNTETYYIPESWYIQQLVEGGIVGLLLLLIVFLVILAKLRKFPALFGAFAGIMVMNVFLHSLESVYTSLICFIIFAAIIPLAHGEQYHKA